MEIFRLIMCLFVVIAITACANSSSKIKETCRQSVITYQDAIECMIRLDNKQ